jgi:hypothetical protein
MLAARLAGVDHQSETWWRARWSLHQSIDGAAAHLGWWGGSAWFGGGGGGGWGPTQSEVEVGVRRRSADSVVVVVWLRWWLRSDSVRGGGGGQEEECGPSLYAACWCRVRSHPHPSCCPAHRASHSFRCVGTAARGLVSEVVLPAPSARAAAPGPSAYSFSRVCLSACYSPGHHLCPKVRHSYPPDPSVQHSVALARDSQVLPSTPFGSDNRDSRP